MGKEPWDLLPGDSHPLHPQQLSLPVLPPAPLLLPQDEKSSHVLGDKVVGISLVDTVVANLSDPVVITFFHNQLPVGGETASPNLIPPRTAGQGGLGPCQGREWSQPSRSVPLACLQALLRLSGLIMASPWALVVAPPASLQELLHCRCVACSTTSPAVGRVEFTVPWLSHGPVRHLLNAEPLV